MTTDEKIVRVAGCDCLAWKPVIAGALVAIAFTFLLNLFSVAIGLTAFTTDSQGIEKLALGGLIATAIGIIASMFAAGWIAGYLGRRYCVDRHLGALYGFLTWSVALIIGILIATYAQHYITFYTHFLSGTTNVIEINSTGTAMNLSANVNNVAAKNLIISTYIIFILFFLSAFACCLGGHSGMRYRWREYVK